MSQREAALLGAVITVFVWLLFAVSPANAGSLNDTPAPGPISPSIELPDGTEVQASMQNDEFGNLVPVYEVRASKAAESFGVEVPDAKSCKDVKMVAPEMTSFPWGQTQTLAPEFQWNIGEMSSDGMRIKIEVVGEGSVILYSASRQELIWFSNLKPNTHYTWRAQYNCGANGRFGPVKEMGFITGSGNGLPPAPHLLSPEADSFFPSTEATTRVDFSWTSGSATHFALALWFEGMDTSRPFLMLFDREPSTWVGFSAGTKIGWSVASHNKFGNSELAQRRNLIVDRDSPTYSIFGRVVDVTGRGVPGITVYSGTLSKTTTDANGFYTLAIVPYGLRTVAAVKENTRPEEFVPVTPNSRSIMLRRNAYGIDFTVDLPPILVVHGFQGFSDTGYNCSQGATLYSGDKSTSTLGELPDQLRKLSYPVFLAHLTTRKLYTPVFQINALCLKGQVEEAYNRSSGRKLGRVCKLD